MSWQRALLVPRVARLAMRAPKDVRTRWDGYWASVRATGAGGDVLWDPGGEREVQHYLHQMRLHMDARLPVVDVGCGNGRFTRALAGLFPFALGVDLSPHAVTRAEEESAPGSSVAFLALDMTIPDAGARIRAETGESNVFVRGLFHVLDPAARLATARNLRHLLGRHGRLLLAETDFKGSSLSYLEHLGARPAGMPAPLERVISFGLPQPSHFGPRELAESFPGTEWETFASGATTIEATFLRDDEPALIPGYFAVLGARAEPDD